MKTFQDELLTADVQGITKFVKDHALLNEEDFLEKNEEVPEFMPSVDDVDTDGIEKDQRVPHEDSEVLYPYIDAKFSLFPTPP